jgi:hypothetical protein
MESNVTVLAVPQLPKVLGFSGLIPFVTLACALWFVPYQAQVYVSEALMAYGAVILSFMGAVHWGVAIDLLSKRERLQLAFSVVPALLAWSALLLPAMYGYAVLLISFVFLCVLDSRASRLGMAPIWYSKLRVPLTVVVSASILSAQAALLLA